MRARPHDRDDEAGFLLLAVIVLVFLVLLTLSIAAPRIAMQIKRDREQETQERADQYTRAIQLYYRKFKHYPSSIEDLKKSNNQRFLRQEYLDPLTGKKDWKLIHVGENKTQVKGFFGEDLPGIAGASGLTSIGSSTLSGSSGSSGSSFGNSSFGNSGSNGSSLGSNSSSSSFGNSSFGNSSSSLGSNSGGGATGSGSGSNSSTGSQSATTFGGSGGGAIMGVGVPKDGEALLTVNEQTNYQDWEFLYDPRIEQLKARATLLGGVSSGSGTSSSGSSMGTPIQSLNGNSSNGNSSTGALSNGNSGSGTTQPSPQ